MEKQKEIKECIDRITDPIFNKVLKETNKNPMSVGIPKKKYTKYCFYNPHNYRLYLDFNKQNLDIKKLRELPKPTKEGSVVSTYRLKNSKEHEIDNFMDCRVTIKKSQVEIQNKIDIERVYRIKITVKANKQLKKIIREKDAQCKKVLKAFIIRFGGTSKLKVLNRHSENKLWNEDSIDLMPIKMKWHNPLSKKVYNEKNIEFNDPAFASNYIETRAVESIAPTINNGLENIMIAINALTDKLIPTIDNLNHNMATHVSVMKGIDKGIKKFNKTVSKLNKRLSQRTLNKYM